MPTVTCRTTDCANAQQAIEVDLTYRDDDGQVKQVATVVCGVCGRPITDIQR